MFKFLRRAWRISKLLITLRFLSPHQVIATTPANNATQHCLETMLHNTAFQQCHTATPCNNSQQWMFHLGTYISQSSKASLVTLCFASKVGQIDTDGKTSWSASLPIEIAVVWGFSRYLFRLCQHWQITITVQIAKISRLAIKSINSDLGFIALRTSIN